MRLPRHEGIEYAQGWDDRSWETLIAFANGSGGVLCLGVAGDGTVGEIDLEETQRAVMRFALNGAEPTMAGLVRVEPRTLDARTAALAFVASGPRRPYVLKDKRLSEDGVFIRMGGETVAATLEEILQIARRSSPLNWVSRTCGRDDLTFDATASFLESRGIPFGPDARTCLGLLADDRRFTGLALLLSDQNDVRITFNRFGQDGSPERCEQVTGPLLEQMRRLRERLEIVNAPTAGKSAGEGPCEMRRPWPDAALCEALAFCVTHRDCDLPLQSTINLWPDRIELLIAGGLPPKLTPDDVVADALMGGGLADIFRSHASRMRKPLLRGVDRSLLLELPREEDDADGSLEERLASFLRASPHGRSRQEVERFLGVSRPTALKLLGSLRQERRIITRGKARSLRYHYQAATAATE